MKRKIIKQGHNTLTITLPSEWVKRFNLQAGSEVDLDEKNNGLFISTEKTNTHKAAEFDISNMDIAMIWKYFMAVYREGYDELKIKFDEKQEFDSPYKFFCQHRLDVRYKRSRDKKTPLEALQNFVTRFIDFEIVEHGKNYVIIKEMGEPSSKQFENSLRRIFLLLQEMAEQTLSAIKTNNAKLVAHMHDVDINLDKFHDYCIRIMNRVGNKDQKKTSLLFSTLYLMELIGDEYKNISNHLLYDFPPKNIFKNIELLAQSVRDQINGFYEIFYKFDVEKLKTLSQLDQSTYMHIPHIYKKSNEDEKEIYHHLRMIERCVNALIELRIEMEF